ncbi:MAG: hypothetical protein R8L07_01885 [Alphaproteobacteria bacterium]|nr:hypothetical protein [Alphaproteobacteria bacterium]
MGGSQSPQSSGVNETRDRLDDGRVASVDGSTPPLKVLTLPETGAFPPEIDGVQAVRDPLDRFDLVALTDQVSPAVLYRTLSEGSGLLCPIIDLTGSMGDMADVSIPTPTQDGFRDALGEIVPVLRRLDEIPSLEQSADSDGLFVLAMAYSRREGLEPRIDPDRKQAMGYPLLRGMPAARKTLEMLHQAGLLSRRHHERLHICSNCQSSRLNIREVDPETGSSNLHEVPLTHHYECGHQAPETEFLRDGSLVCPKCRRTLHHFGVDYDKPGTVLVSGESGEAVSDPEVEFVCLDCQSKIPGDSADTVDWFAYDLTEDGKTAVRSGRLPHVDLTDLLTGTDHARSLRDFLILVDHDNDTALRYERPLSLCRFDIVDGEEMRRTLGRRGASETLSAIITVLVEVLRETDYVTSRGDSIYVAMPETTPENARKAFRRVEEQIGKSIREPPKIAVKLFSSPDLDEGLNPLRTEGNG